MTGEDIKFWRRIAAEDQKEIDRRADEWGRQWMVWFGRLDEPFERGRWFTYKQRKTGEYKTYLNRKKKSPGAWITYWTTSCQKEEEIRNVFLLKQRQWEKEAVVSEE